MKKIISFFIGIFMLMVSSYAQSYDTTNYYGKMNYIFHYLNKSLVTTGLLRDYGVEFLNLDNYTGSSSLHDSNYVSVHEWKLLYSSLYSSQINNNANLLGLDSVNRLIDKYNYSNMSITFISQHYNYEKFKDNAVTSNLLSVSSGRLYDVSGRPSSPYETKSLFAVAPIRQAAFTGHNEFIFRPELFLSNNGKTISQVAYKKQGTSTYQAVAFNTPFSIVYDSAGVYDISIRIKYTDNSYAYSHTKIVVYENNIATRYGDTIPKLPVTAIKPYLGTYGQADIHINYAEGNTTGTIRKPLIVVEGFDPGDGYAYDFKEFIESIYYNTNYKEYWNHPITLGDGLDDIHEYDLIFVNWKDGTDYIQRNAYVLEAVIKYVNDYKTTYGGVRQQNVVIGLSMGGLVGRYALRDMELTAQNHETRLFITHDSPHKGANIPVGLQMMVQQLAPWELINISFKPFSIKYKDIFPEVKDAMAFFNSPAAKQMLKQRFFLTPSNTAQADNSVHTAFMSEYETMGWPINSRNLTLSNGSCNGTKQFPDNSTILSIDGHSNLNYGQNVGLSFLMSLLGGTRPLSNLILTKNSIDFNGWAMLAQFPLSLLSTKSSIGMDFKVRAVPASGTQEIYRGDIFSKKKILWAININTYLVKCRVNSTSGMLPLDNAPGGVHDVNVLGFNAEEIENQLPDLFDYKNVATLQHRFCFIPTASALDISNFNANYLKPLCDTAACIGPARVKDYFAPLTNEIHITYTQPSANWILAQQGSGVNCTKICKNNLYLDGISQLCTTNTYMTNLPPGATATWSVTPSSAAIITPVSVDNSSIQLTKSALWNGSIMLNLQIQNPCNSNVVVLSKKLYAGTPTPAGPIPIAVGSSPIKPNTVYPFTSLNPTLPAEANITEYQWEVITGGTVYGGTQSNQHGQIKTETLGVGQSEKNITVRFRWKGCTWSDWAYYYGRIVRNGGRDPLAPLSFIVQPNPASNEVSIVQQFLEEPSAKINSASRTALSVEEQSGSIGTKNIEWIKVTDITGNIKTHQIINNYSDEPASPKIDVSGWTPGHYIAYIFDGETIHHVSFIVKH